MADKWPLTPCPSGYIGTRPKNARDQAWKYAYEAPDEPTKVICIRCEKVISGGIYRFKYHIAGISKHDTNPCESTTEEIKRFANALLAAGEQKKLQRERNKLHVRAAIAETQGSFVDVQEEEAAIESMAGSYRGPRVRKQGGFSFTSSAPTPTPTPPSTSAPSGSVGASGIGSYFVPRHTPGAQPSLEATRWNKEVHDQVDNALADFWVFNNLPISVVDSPYWEALATGLTVAGKGYKSPSRFVLGGRYVNNFITLDFLLIFNLLLSSKF